MIRKRKLVSILIPVYNREALIGETIQSAIKQSYEDIEIVVVDNCSTDNTWKILQDFARRDSRIRIFRNEKNIGAVRNWKKCIDSATGCYGKILWSDDLISPDFLEKTVPFLENPNVGFVYTPVICFGEGKKETNFDYLPGKQGYYSSNEFIEGSLLGHNYPVSPGCALFRMQDLRKNLIVDLPKNIKSNFTQYAIGNDVLIFLLTAKDYPLFAFSENATSYFRAHANSITISSERAKIPLHYALAKSFFIDRHFSEYEYLNKEFNAILQLLLLKYYNNSYNLKKITDFYIKNKRLKFSYKYLVNCLIERIVLKTKSQYTLCYQALKDRLVPFLRDE